MPQTTENSQIINASPEATYKAFTDAQSLEAWLAPTNMRGKVHEFDFRVGGGYRMSLFYSETEKDWKGKTSEKEDRFTSRFLELIPNEKIVQAVNFDSPDPAFSGEMIMETTFKPVSQGTKVTMRFTNIPVGIKPEDNEAGTASTLEKLARHVESN